MVLHRPIEITRLTGSYDNNALHRLVVSVSLILGIVCVMAVAFKVQCNERWAPELKLGRKHSLVEQQAACANSEGNGPDQQDCQGVRYLVFEQKHCGCS